MFLKAGALSLVLLLASRVLGLARESAQAAAFGTSGMADVAVLMLTLPDWVAGIVASGALAYVLVPAWAGQGRAQVEAGQRKVAVGLLGAGTVLALALMALREPALAWLAGGLPPALHPLAAQALIWSALALPASLLAALWATRLQHERDFVGMYAANLVVNVSLIAAIVGVATAVPGDAVQRLGLGLLLAMGLRLAWLALRHPRRQLRLPRARAKLPAPPLWLWAALSAGLPLSLPFVARSVASQSGEGALATFNYAWKLVELPLVLAIQLVAALAFPAVARAVAPGSAASAGAEPLRSAFALSWALACGAVAGLLVAAPALARLLFGWGRMPASALADVAGWGAAGAWSLLPQALAAVALMVLAAQGRMLPAVLAYALALLCLLGAAAAGVQQGLALMWLLNAVFAAVALLTLAALGRPVLKWLPWPAIGWALIVLAGVALLAPAARELLAGQGAAVGLAAGVVAGALPLLAAAAVSHDLRRGLRR